MMPDFEMLQWVVSGLLGIGPVIVIVMAVLE